MRFMGSAQFNPHVNGGFSEYVAVKPEQCIAYDSRVPANVMAFSEPLAVAIHAVKMAGQLIGKRVLVIGAGPIGCLILAAAKSAGASDVVACDLSPRCLELAQQMGATAVMDPRDEKRSAYYQQNRGYFGDSINGGFHPPNRNDCTSGYGRKPDNLAGLCHAGQRN